MILENLLSYMFQFQVPYTPLVCVLSFVGDTLGNEYLRDALQRILSEASKLLSAYWLDYHILFRGTI